MQNTSSPLNTVIDNINTEFSNGQFDKTLELVFEAFNFDEALENAHVHLRKGQCHLEMGDLDNALDTLLRAYMLGGKGIFENEDAKYLAFLQSKTSL